MSSKTRAHAESSFSRQYLYRFMRFYKSLDDKHSGVTATPGAPAPPEGPRVLGVPARGKEKIFLFTFRLVIKRI